MSAAVTRAPVGERTRLRLEVQQLCYQSSLAKNELFLHKLESGPAHFDGVTAAAPGLEESFRIVLTVVDQYEASPSKAGKKVMTFITNREMCCAFRKAQHSRVYLSHAAVTHSCVNFHSKPKP